MTSHTARTQCPKCSSDDCNSTIADIGALIVLDIRTRSIYCNACGYTKVSLLISNKVLVTETKLPGDEDTEIEYYYLGRERG